MTAPTNEALRDIVLTSPARIVPEMDRSAVSSGVPLRDQLDLDSMDFLNFLVALKEAVGVEVPEADYAKVSTLRDVVNYLSARLNK